VAVRVTLWSLPSHGTAMLPVPLVGKPAAAGSGWPSTEKLTAWVFCVSQEAATSAVPPGQVTSSSRWNRLINGAPTGGGEVDVFTWRETEARPAVPLATRATSCSLPSQG